MRAIAAGLVSMNHMAPSGPAVMAVGVRPAPNRVAKPGSSNTVTVPAGVIRPTESPAFEVNQTLPSGPAAMPFGVCCPTASLGAGTGNSL
jgi:hypothetical protein